MATMSQFGVIELEDGWTRIKTQGIDHLERLLDSGFNKEVQPFTHLVTVALYNMCYHMCTQRAPKNWSDQLYARHNEAIKTYLRAKVLPALRHKRGTFLLQELVSRWEQHKIMNRWMYKLFMYLDRYYVEHHNMPPLQEAGLRAFRLGVFDEVRAELVLALLELVNKDRDGAAGVDRSLIRKCVEVYTSMGEGTLEVYIDEFQAPLLRASRDYYVARASEWLLGDNVASYLSRAEETLVAEAGRVQSYMNAHTEDPLLRVVETALLADQQARLLDNEGSGLRAMLREDKREDLARLYRLFSRVGDGLVPIARTLREYFQEIGLGIVRERESGAGKAAAAAAAGGAGATSGAGGAAAAGTSAGAGASAAAGGKAKEEGGSSGAKEAKEDASDPSFVQALLDLHDRARAIVNTDFAGNTLFQKALKDAFEVFVNKEAPPPLKLSNAELIASYADRLLKTGGDKLSEEAIESGLERLVALFSYVTDKDIFGDIYRGQLAKRILNGRSVSNDTERAAILKLKLRCGAQYTSKMEGMLNDLEKADNKAGDAAEFRAHCAAKRVALPGGMDFTVQVLTTGFWPSFPRVELRLPAAFQGCVDAFAAFYGAKTQHRRLLWCHALGNATVRGTYAAGGGAGKAPQQYEFSVTTLQAAAMVLLDDRGPGARLGFEEVREALGCDAEAAKRVLHSLACGKYRVLAKTPDSQAIGAADTFTVNAAFACALRRVRIPMASLEELAGASKRVEEDRGLAIEASLVRIMKARKSLPHAQLVTECMAQLHFFRPNPKLIKKKIEHLLERDYLERDAADPNTYKYLA